MAFSSRARRRASSRSMLRIRLSLSSLSRSISRRVKEECNDLEDGCGCGWLRVRSSGGDSREDDEIRSTLRRKGKQKVQGKVKKKYSKQRKELDPSANVKIVTTT